MLNLGGEPIAGYPICNREVALFRNWENMGMPQKDETESISHAVSQRCRDGIPILMIQGVSL